MSSAQSIFLSENEIRKLLGLGLSEELQQTQDAVSNENLNVDPSTGQILNLPALYNGRFVDSAGTFHYKVDLKPYWQTAPSPYQGFRKTSDIQGVLAYSKKAPAYGRVVFKTKLADLAALGAGDIWFGFELGGGMDWGLAAFHHYMSGGVEKFEAWANFGGYVRAIDLTPILSLSVAKTTAYAYSVKLNKNGVEFWIDNRIVAIWLTGFNGVISAPPYGIMGWYGEVPPYLQVLVEVGGPVGTEILFPLTPTSCRFTAGDPLPPRAYQMYVSGTGTLLAGYSLSSGSVTSHPIPVFGYKEWELLIDANQDFTVQLQYLGLSGNWRTFDNYSSPTGSNRIHLLIDEPMTLARVVITPSAYPMTINDALAVMVS